MKRELRRRAKKFFNDAPASYGWQFNHDCPTSFIDDLTKLLEEVAQKAFVRGQRKARKTK